MPAFPHPPSFRNLRIAAVIYGGLNAILYAGLTPLWEGFDEPFHYAYVQQLWNTRSLPVQKRTCLPEEIWQSFPLAPASHIVQRNLPMVTTFEDYFRLPQSERLLRRRRLEHLDPHLAAADSGCLNYEAQQAPLAYAVLAPFNAIWARSPLLTRIWRLRLVCALFSSLATGALLFRLTQLLAFPEVFRITAVFLVFSSQMFYATTAHVANDWLALPLLLLILCSGISLYLNPRSSIVWMLAVSLAAGLLAKAYFLAMVPFAFGLVLLCCLRRKLSWRQGSVFAAVSLALGAPWYIRNLLLYRDLSGQQETIGGTPVPALLRTALHLPWLHSIATTALTSLWEGNSSATTFGSTTVGLMLALLFAGACLYLWDAFHRRPPLAERLLIAGLFCYSAGLAYSTVLLYFATRGAGITPAPWYVELLQPPALCLLLAGMLRAGRAGHVLRIAMLWLWTYMISATYVAKLIPLYGGYSGRPVRPIEIARWYTGSFRQINDVLGTTAIISPAALFILTASVVAAAVFLAWRLQRAV